MGFCTAARVPRVHARRRRSSSGCSSAAASTWSSSGSRCRAPSSAPGSSSGRSTRCGSGSSRPIDLASLDKWDDYTEAKEAMFFYTDTADAPWTVVKSNDKKRARLEAMRHVLSRFDYPDKDDEVVGEPDPLIVGPAASILETDKNPGADAAGRARLRPRRRPVTPLQGKRSAVSLQPPAARLPLLTTPTSSSATPRARSWGSSRRLRLSSAKPGNRARPTTWSHSSHGLVRRGQPADHRAEERGAVRRLEVQDRRADVLARQRERLVGLGLDLLVPARRRRARRRGRPADPPRPAPARRTPACPASAAVVSGRPARTRCRRSARPIAS